MTELEMIPTNGKCPDGIDGKFVWLQDIHGTLTCAKFIYGDCVDWDYYIAYCVVEDEDSIPKKYVHIEEEKWIGKLCKFYDSREDFKSDKNWIISILGNVQNNKDGSLSFLIKPYVWYFPYCKPFSLETDSDLLYK